VCSTFHINRAIILREINKTSGGKKKQQMSIGTVIDTAEEFTMNMVKRRNNDSILTFSHLAGGFSITMIKS
jgi:hypothetical protein